MSRRRTAKQWRMDIKQVDAIFLEANAAGIVSNILNDLEEAEGRIRELHAEVRTLREKYLANDRY